MKKIFFMLIIGMAIGLGACNSATTTDRQQDSLTRANPDSNRTTTLPPPSSNSDATNPSLPDTTIIKPDSSSSRK